MKIRRAIIGTTVLFSASCWSPADLKDGFTSEDVGLDGAGVLDTEPNGQDTVSVQDAARMGDTSSVADTTTCWTVVPATKGRMTLPPLQVCRARLGMGQLNVTMSETSWSCVPMVFGSEGLFLERLWAICAPVPRKSLCARPLLLTASLKASVF